MINKHQPKPDSPEKYIRTRARSLPLGECYMNTGWKDSGMAFIMVTRRHTNGHLTLAGFQVDLYCLGVKDAFWLFNTEPEVLTEMKMKLEEQSAGSDELITADYVLVHNIIYGALAYAEDLGFSPHRDFSLAQFILEEDDERIDLMDIEFGMDGLPAVIIGKEDHPERILEILDRYAGKGNYRVISEDGDLLDRLEGPFGNEDDDEDASDRFDMEVTARGKPITRDMMNLTNERLMKYLGEQEFENFEELQAFVAANMTGKRINEIIPKKKGRRTNKDKADDLMYKAYESNPGKGIRLAHQALELDPESIRAYNYLAQHEPDPVKALALCEKAANMGKKQLDEAFFKENKGHFWMITETRPYMTAMFGMAQCYESMGREKEAMKVYEELLSLNPNDNQGARDMLARLYLKHARFEQFSRLHKKFEDEGTALWLYNYAFYLFKTQGNSKNANNALQEAYRANKHVLEIMKGKEKLPRKLGDSYCLGQPDEAAFYLMDYLDLWESDLEVMRWVVHFAAD